GSSPSRYGVPPSNRHEPGEPQSNPPGRAYVTVKVRVTTSPTTGSGGSTADNPTDSEPSREQQEQGSVVASARESAAASAPVQTASSNAIPVATRASDLIMDIPPLRNQMIGTRVVVLTGELP